MTQLLSLSRAARLAGVTRSELQKRIRQGELTTFEGEIAAADLLRIYPEVNLEHSGDLERVERIKADALPRSHQGEGILPDAQVLIGRLKSLSQVLVQKAAALETAEAMLAELDARLAAMAESTDPNTAVCTREIQAWLAAERHQLARRSAADSQARLFAKDTFLRIMAANVKLVPSGHDFFVEGTESILDASVRAGLKLAYGCSSGNCGACKARVVSGEVYKTREHDYVLSGREKQLGHILTCSNTAVTDLVLKAAEALAVDDLPQQEIRAGVRKVERLGEDMIQLELQTPRTQTLRFMAGQRAHLTLEDGAGAELPIASCPCNGRNLHFLVRLRPGHRFSQTLFHDLRQGQTVTVTGPNGRFVLEEESPEPAVFVAFGDGIAPIKSLLEHAVSIDVIESFHLYWAVSGLEGQYQAQWCRAMRESLDNFAYTPLVDARTADVLAVVASDRPEPDSSRYYVAGPAAQVRPFADGLTGLSVSPDRLLVEALD
ncbi:2Fe-2S iron-sulfur cluster-binding protein [Candidatus Thiosymbion oneisti]|uniref:2Fe-2S iron-sulfur cluster-binding protein n=1 Tax=Candidatus Thiosymbion oneisti TaxID=589554 RepID=UPI00105B8F27|nr:2Fe-2S iron-sulfur cluster-binding protein [Candidatus Thiosymbion oneisti]